MIVVMSELQDAITRNVRHVMADFDVDQEAIATVLGISPGAVSNKVSGKRPWRMDDIARLSVYFRISEMEFVKEKRVAQDPFLAATGTDSGTARRTGRSAGSPYPHRRPTGRPDATIIAFPQVNSDARELDRPGTLLVLRPYLDQRRDRPNDTASIGVNYG